MNTQELAEILHGAPRRIHLIGVAGSGMSGIAGLLLALGHQVSGSDKVDTVEVKRLQSLGLDFRTPQRAEDVVDAQLVIYSSAIREGNAAYDAAQEAGWCTFYNRDRGESGTEWKVANTFAEFMEQCNHCDAEYYYIMKDGVWYTGCPGEGDALVPLATALAPVAKTWETVDL